MKDIKLIAIDLDDTLLKNDLTISPRAKRAIAKSVDKGVAVTLATGRMYASALPYALDLKIDLPLITYQGALVKYADGRVVYHQPLPLALAGELIDFIRPYGLHVNLYINDELFMEELSPEGHRYKKLSRVPVHKVDDLSEALTAEPSKIVVIAEKEKLDILTRDLSILCGGDFNVTRSKPHFLELGHPKATKGLALESLANSMNLVARQVMAVGDSWNDLDMIQYAGLGVAMENAAPEIKQQADYITCANDDDGVAEAIEKWVLNE